MKISRRDLLKLSAGAAALAALPLRAEETLTLWGPPVTPTVLLAVAAQQGAARKIRPFKVEAWKSPDQLRAGLINKTIEISIVPSYVAANLRAQGQKVVLYNIMTTGLLVLLAKDKAIASIKELDGQKIVMPFKNDMPDLVLQILAAKAGLDLKDKLTYTATPPEAVMLFLQKDFPVAQLPEPLVSAALLQGKKLQVPVQRGLRLDTAWNEAFGTKNGMAQAGLMVSEAFLKEQGEFLTALQQDLQDAVAWVAAHPAEAAQLASAYMPAPLPALEQSFPHSGLCALRASDIGEEILLFLKELHRLNPKVVGGTQPDASLFG